MAPRPFRFAVQATDVTSRTAWAEYARKAEDRGYSRLVMLEHISWGGLAPLSALMAAADATSRIRVATHVLINDLRNPGMLAQEAATLDLLSERATRARVGAGWLTADLEAAGVPLEPASTRVRRLAEAVSLLKRLLP